MIFSLFRTRMPADLAAMAFGFAIALAASTSYTSAHTLAADRNSERLPVAELSAPLSPGEFIDGPSHGDYITIAGRDRRDHQKGRNRGKRGNRDNSDNDNIPDIGVIDTPEVEVPSTPDDFIDTPEVEVPSTPDDFLDTPEVEIPSQG